MRERRTDLDADVIVVGGAVAGAALANALGMLGVRVLMLEKVRRDVRSTRGDLLHPATLALLDRWGVLSSLRADGAIPITELAVSRADGELVARFPVTAVDDGPAGRTLAVPHDRIEAILWACARRRPTVRTARGSVTALVLDDRGRTTGVRFRAHRAGAEAVLRARVVVGCDGAQSLVRRALGIGVEREEYRHEEIILAARGAPELPHALHWYLDEAGGLGVVARPRQQCRIILALPLGARGDLLHRQDPALRDYLVGRFPPLVRLRFGKADAHVYRLARQMAERFWSPGAALVGDAAHTTHPTGATGMGLAIGAAAAMAERLGPVLLAGGDVEAVDAALESYDVDRRPVAAAAVALNHARALLLWESGLHRDPEAYARAVDPAANWGPAAGSWGRPTLRE